MDSEMGERRHSKELGSQANELSNSDREDKEVITSTSSGNFGTNGGQIDSLNPQGEEKMMDSGMGERRHSKEIHEWIKQKKCIWSSGEVTQNCTEGKFANCTEIL